jgi:hypothetical protein
MMLIYLSPVPWHSFAQRPHKFVGWLHNKMGCDVLWLEPYPTRLPHWSDIKSIGSREVVQTQDTPNWLTVIQPPAWPIEPIWGVRYINDLMWCQVLSQVGMTAANQEVILVVGKPSRLAIKLLSFFKDAISVYDAMDDFPAFYRGLSKLSMKNEQAKVVSQVSYILASSHVLLKKFAELSNKVIFSPNACAIETLPTTISTLAGKDSNRQVLGYVGTIANWFDWPLIFKLAEAHPEIRVRLIGPVHAYPPQALLANMELLPACDHKTALKYMQEFSIGLIPFRQTELTESVDPIKYYEYKALGLPIISTFFGEMTLRHDESGVFFVDANTDIVDIVQSALSYQYSAEDINQFRAANSWEARFDATGIL